MQKTSVPPARIRFSKLVLALIFTSSLSVSGASNNHSTAAPETKADGESVLMRAGSNANVEAIPGSADTQVFGWIEHVILSPELRWKLDAKLDTGAETSSLDAHKIRRVRYKGKSYVRFSIRDPESGKMISLRRPYVRSVRIRRHNGNHQRRRVVLMTVCLGQSQRTIEVTLTDRKLFDYPMLLGRSALAGLAVVDPMDTYTMEPDCRAQSGDDETVDAEAAEPSQAVSSVAVQRDEEEKPRNVPACDSFDRASMRHGRKSAHTSFLCADSVTGASEPSAVLNLSTLSELSSRRASS